MQVNAILIDELVVDEASSMPVARPVLFAFDTPTLVSARRVDQAQRVGPVGVLSDSSDPAVTVFPERTLEWENKSAADFSYKEPWTVAPWTLYVLVPPTDFVASPRSIRELNGDVTEALVPASTEDRIFYFRLFGHASDRHGFQTEARLTRNPDAVQRELGAVETVEGNRTWRRFSEPLVGPLRASRSLVGAAAAIRTLFGL